MVYWLWLCRFFATFRWVWQSLAPSWRGREQRRSLLLAGISIFQVHRCRLGGGVWGLRYPLICLSSLVVSITLSSGKMYPLLVFFVKPGGIVRLIMG